MRSEDTRDDAWHAGFDGYPGFGGHPGAIAVR
jgi:hypothetical protein